jgi:hypothetical protein
MIFKPIRSGTEMQPIISKVSADGKKQFVLPDGDAARGIWLDVGSDLETMQFPPSPRALPAMTLAPWGAGKGVKGGAAALVLPKPPKPTPGVPKGYADPAMMDTLTLTKAVAYARLESDEGTTDMQTHVQIWLDLAAAELARRG